VGVHDLDQKAWKVSLLRSTRLEKTQNKQATFMVAFIMYECVSKYLALVGIYHYWGTSSKRVLAFCKTKTLGCLYYSSARFKDLL
jgi:hypothetical protein